MEFLEQLAGAILNEAHGERRWPVVQSAAATALLTDAQGRRAPAAEIFAGEGNVLILGAAGAGKTTLLRSRAATLASNYLAGSSGLRHSRAPLFLRATDLKKFRSETGIVGALTQSCRPYVSDIPRGLLGDLLRTGKIELLVDGIDELGIDWNPTVADLSDLFRTTPQLRAIVSSRPAALTVNFTNFSAYSIPSLDRSRAYDLVQQLSGGAPELANRFISEILDRPELAALTQSPLMLSMLFDLYIHTGRVPPNRSMVYQLIVDILFKREREKAGRGKWLNPYQRYELTAAAAVAMEDGGIAEISLGQLSEIAAKMLPRPLLPGRLEEELAMVGLFVQVAPGRFSFSHRSFQEFFVAFNFREDPAGLVPFLHRDDGDAVLEFAGGLVGNIAMLVEKAIAQGKLVLAAKMVTASMYDNKALKSYVAQAFRQTLGSDFIELLTRELPEGSQVRKTAPEAIRSGFSEKVESIAVAPPVPPEPAAAALEALDFGESAPFETLLALLDGVRDDTLTHDERGRSFEDFVASFFGRVFIVAERNQLTDRGEIDLLLDFSSAGPFWLCFGNEALVECKNLGRKVTYAQTSTFITKVRQARRKIGFILSFSGFTRDAMRALYDNLADPAAPIVIAIAGEEIRECLQLGGSIDEFLKGRWRRMVQPRRGSR